jgi:hypothetical protein
MQNRFHAPTAALLTTLLAGGLFACSDKNKEGAETAQASAPAKAEKKVELPAHFKLIPADSPYVFATFEKMPPELVEQFFKVLGPVMGNSVGSLDAQMAGSEDPAEKFVAALLANLKDIKTAADLEKLGLSKTPHFAMYGLGLFPALRMELSDGAKVKGLIDAAAKKAGVDATSKKEGDADVWSITQDNMTVLAGIGGNHLFAAAYPASMDAKLRPMVVGGSAPAQNHGDGAAVKDLIAKYKFKNYMVGWINADAIAATIVGDGAGLAKEGWDAFAKVDPSAVQQFTPECKTEIKGLVANAPRMVIGYDDFSAKLMSARMVVETKDTLRKDLAALRAPVPGLDGNYTGQVLFAFGLGLDLQKTLDFAKKKAMEIQSAPYKCAELAGLNDGARDMAQQLAMPTIPPVALQTKGLNMILSDADVKGGNLGPQAAATAKATAVISHDNPMGVIALLQTMVPQLAQLQVKDDGTPVAIPPALANGMVAEPHLAVKGKMMAISIGQGMKASIPKLFEAKAPADPPLLAFGYDAGLFLDSMATQMEGMMAMMPPESQAEMKANVQMQKAMAAIMGLTSYAVFLNDQGIVMKQTVAFE